MLTFVVLSGNGESGLVVPRVPFFEEPTTAIGCSR